MPAFLFHIAVRPDSAEAAVETLSEIEAMSRLDTGCLDFTWLRHATEPNRFTLFERWDTQENLDAHLDRIIPRWRLFTPYLAEEPVSHQVRPIGDELARTEVAS